MKRIRWLVFGMTTLLASGFAHSADCLSNGNGNWNAAATWTSCGGGTPGAADTATIRNNHNVTLTAAAAAQAVTITSATPNNTTSTLIVGTQTLTIGAGGLTISGGNGNRRAELTLSSGTVTVQGDVVIAGNTSNARITFTGAGALNVAGDVDSGATFTPATGTVNYNGSGAQSVGAYTYNNFTVSNVTGVVSAPSSFDVNGTLNMNGAGTTLAPDPGVVVGGTGTLTGTGTVRVTRTAATADFDSQYTIATKTLTNLLVDYVGGAAQILSARTYGRLRVNNESGVTLAGNATVGSTLTLTAGVVTTGANTLITTASCASAVARTAGHVAGMLRMAIPAGASTCTFHVGGATVYRPMTLVFVAGTTAGNLTGSVSQSAGDHPSIASSGLDESLSVNRYWTLVNGGVGLPGAGFSATFTFVAGDVDAGADPLQFEVERFSGGAWSTTTTGTRTATTTQASAINGFGDFAVAAKKSVIVTPGSFNAFETATAAGAITGVVRTKVAGTAFSLDVVSISGGAQQNAFNDSVIVELLGNNSLGVPLDANNCPTSSTLVQTVSPHPTITNGRSTVAFAAVANSWRDVRVRVSWPTGSPSVVTCSTDNFAIRPSAFTALTVSDNDWESAGTGRALTDVTFGSVTHKAGRPFSVRANAVNGGGAVTSNYAGTPTVVRTACAGAACTSSFGTLSLDAAFSSGQLATDAATYSEVGAFRLQLVDATFAQVDAADSSSAEREIVSAALDVGRFVPDHFTVAYNAPSFAAACGAFTYVGQVFNYGTAPVITVTARNFANDTTALYEGTWWRLTNSTLTPVTQAARYAAASGALDLALVPAVSADPAIAVAGGGSGTLTFSAGSGIAFARTGAVAPFDAEISVALNVIDADGVALASNPARFGQASAGNGMAFTGGKAMRFGRLRLDNATGSEKLDLPIPIRTEYWTGSAFVTNAADNCTSINAAHAAFSDYFGGINAGNMNAANVSGLGGAFSAGVGSLTLTKPLPTPTSRGAVSLGIDLSAAGRSYLKGNWGVTTFTADPKSRAAFGLFGGQPSQFIYFRENY
ncbi:MAG TPA: DUF6701 domain-containing protein [Burkholderiales bacterium]|nr:DUF6701 domain-containing protein [Burkholderiales bacterium]